MNITGKLDPAKVTVLRVTDLVQHVAQNRIGDPGLDELDQILIVDCAADLVLSKRGERNHRHSSTRLSGNLTRPSVCRRIRAGRKRCLEEPVRCEPDLELSHFRGRGCRIRRRPLHVPGGIAADDEVLLLLALERRAAAPLRRIVALPSRRLLARGPVLVVDRPRVARDFEAWPIGARSEALAHGGVHAGSRNLDGPEGVGAHVLGSRLQNSPGILRGGGSGRHAQNGDESEDMSCHNPPPPDVIPSFSLG